MHNVALHFSQLNVSTRVLEYLDLLKFDDGVVSEQVFRAFGFDMVIYYFDTESKRNEMKELNKDKQSFTGFDSLFQYFIILPN